MTDNRNITDSTDSTDRQYDKAHGAHDHNRDQGAFYRFSRFSYGGNGTSKPYNSMWGRFFQWLMVSYPHSWIRCVLPPLFYGWLVSLGFQPKNHTILAFMGLVLFYRHLERKLFHTGGQGRALVPSKRLFLTGYAFGFAYVLGGLYWIVYALHIDWVQYAVLVPLVLIGIPGILGMSFGVLTKILHIVSRSPLVSRAAVLLAFILLWSGLEYARGHLLTGFPWLMVSELWLSGDLVIQSLSLFGPYGLGLMTLILFAFLYSILFFESRYRKINLIAFLGLGSAFVFYGQWRLTHEKTTFHDDFDIVIVQPNILQVHKWDPQKLNSNIDTLIHLSKQSQLRPRRDEARKPKIYIWPEAAVPYRLESGSPLASYMTQFLKEGDVLLTGYNRRVIQGTSDAPQVFNSLAALDHNGSFRETYDKSHLVPFGEYVPLRSWMPGFIDTLAPGFGDFARGPGLQTISLSGFPGFSPLICYEAIFSREVVNPQDRPQWLLNITNDGWYLGSAGIYQHLHITRMRAIEEGIPLVRVNYRGVSAVFDAKGRLVDEIPFDRADGKQIHLPKALGQRTLYSLYGESLYGALMLMMIALLVGLLWRARQQV